MANDFCNDLKSILRAKHVKTMLKALNDRERVGWEKWLQFELVRYYHENNHDPYWEYPYSNNMQHKPDNMAKRIDLVYRKKNTNTSLYNGVEIKVMYPEYSISGILKDLSRVALIKRSEWELRAVTGLSVYPTEVMEGKKEYSKYKTFVNSLLRTKRGKLLRCNGWSLLVLGWEAKVIGDASVLRQQYKDYLQSLKAIANKHDIEVAC